MKKNPKKIVFPSELRFDLASKDWVVVATGRAKRPEHFKREKRKIKVPPKKDCPFCQPEILEKTILIYSNGKKIPVEKRPIFRIPRGGKTASQRRAPDYNPPPTHPPRRAPTEGVWSGGRGISDWTTIVIPNKFPAFLPSPKLETRIEGGLYQIINAVGFHEIVITRDHEKSMAQFSIEQVKEVIDVYQERYLDLMKKKFVNYISIFHNHGFEAGASIFHPHSQIAAIPLIDTDLRKGLLNSKRFFKKEHQCTYCLMGEWERKTKTRIVFENEDFLVLCPFASKAAFEVIISPKKHSAYFERITEEQKWKLAEAFKVALSKLYQALNDPPYNFYLHTAPCDGKNYDFYHWHFTILPKTATWAGFELGVGMEISTIEPEKAAEYLRKQVL